MERYFKIPLLFLFIASLIGVVLRLQMVSPLFINYKYFLHGHSHIMFLGWVFNTLYLAFTCRYIPEVKVKAFKTIFWTLQLMNVGILIAFPIQGYGTFSIIFSTAHTFISFIFIFLFFKRSSKKRTQSLLLAKISLIFFAISSLGPFALAYIMANDVHQSHWYNYAIYFYLHFQYNGFFFFGIASLFVEKLERDGMISTAKLKTFWMVLAFAVFPTYLLSVLYTSPGLWVNVIAMTGAMIQLFALVYFRYWITREKHNIQIVFKRSYGFLALVAAALILKFVLQFLSAYPTLAIMAYELRPIVIAYLHLVLVGFVTAFLLLWYREQNYFQMKFNTTFSLFMITFIVMELTLIASPWWPERIFTPSTHLLLATACLLSYFFLKFLLSYETPATTNSNTAQP